MANLIFTIFKYCYASSIALLKFYLDDVDKNDSDSQLRRTLQRNSCRATLERSFRSASADVFHNNNNNNYDLLFRGLTSDAHSIKIAAKISGSSRHSDVVTLATLLINLIPPWKASVDRISAKWLQGDFLTPTLASSVKWRHFRPPEMTREEKVETRISKSSSCRSVWRKFNFLANVSSFWAGFSLNY